MHVGPGALSRLAADEVLDPTSGAVLQKPIASSVQYLTQALRTAFGQRDQDLATAALDRFFGFSRQGQKMTLAEYAVEFETRYDRRRAGPDIN